MKVPVTVRLYPEHMPDLEGSMQWTVYLNEAQVPEFERGVYHLIDRLRSQSLAS